MVCLNNTNEPKEPEHVLQWCRNLTNTLNDGGIWGIPRSSIAFRIDKPRKRLILVVGHEDDDDYIATKRVFAQIGWGVVTEKEAQDEQ